MMLTEKDLLKEIIILSPVPSLWKVSYSWDKLGDLIGSIAEINSENKSLSIAINEDAKLFLSEVLDKCDLTDWIIHQSITDDLGNILFESYDHMTTSLVSPKFPNKDILVSKYVESDLLDFTS